MNKPIVVYGVTFEAPLKYMEGQTITSNEAAALNTLFHRDLYESMRKPVQTARKEVGDQTAALPDDKLEVLRRAFKILVESHNFAPKAPLNSYDPVRLEAIKIATGPVRAALQRKGIKNIDAEELDRHVNSAVDKYPQFMAEARKRIEAIRNLTDQTFQLDQAPPPSEASDDA